MTIKIKDISWKVTDCFGNNIYLTEERWNHIIDPINHPIMREFELHLKETLKKGKRIQNPLNPQKYRYSKQFEDLTEYNTHIVALVLFKFKENHEGKFIPNNYIVTAFPKKIGG